MTRKRNSDLTTVYNVKERTFFERVSIIVAVRDYVHQKLRPSDSATVTRRPFSVYRHWIQANVNDPFFRRIGFCDLIPVLNRSYIGQAFAYSLHLKPYTDADVLCRPNKYDQRLWQIFQRYRFAGSDLFVNVIRGCTAPDQPTGWISDAGTAFEAVLYLLLLGKLKFPTDFNVSPSTSAGLGTNSNSNTNPTSNPAASASNDKINQAGNAKRKRCLNPLYPSFTLSTNCLNVLARAIQHVIRAWDVVARILHLRSVEQLTAPYLVFDHSMWMYRPLGPHEGFAPDIQAKSFRNLSDRDAVDERRPSYHLIRVGRSTEAHASLRHLTEIFISDLNTYVLNDKLFENLGHDWPGNHFIEISEKTLLHARFDECIDVLRHAREALHGDPFEISEIQRSNHRLDIPSLSSHLPGEIDEGDAKRLKPNRAEDEDHQHQYHENQSHFQQHYDQDDLTAQIANGHDIVPDPLAESEPFAADHKSLHRNGREDNEHLEQEQLYNNDKNKCLSLHERARKRKLLELKEIEKEISRQRHLDGIESGSRSRADDHRLRKRQRQDNFDGWENYDDLIPSQSDKVEACLNHLERSGKEQRTQPQFKKARRMRETSRGVGPSSSPGSPAGVGIMTRRRISARRNGCSSPMQLTDPAGEGHTAEHAVGNVDLNTDYFRERKVQRVNGTAYSNGTMKFASAGDHDENDNDDNSGNTVNRENDENCRENERADTIRRLQNESEGDDEVEIIEDVVNVSRNPAREEGTAVGLKQENEGQLLLIHDVPDYLPEISLPPTTVLEVASRVKPELRNGAVRSGAGPHRWPGGALPALLTCDVSWLRAVEGHECGVYVGQSRVESGRPGLFADRTFRPGDTIAPVHGSLVYECGGRDVCGATHRFATNKGSAAVSTADFERDAIPLPTIRALWRIDEEARVVKRVFIIPSQACIASTMINLCEYVTQPEYNETNTDDVRNHHVRNHLANANTKPSTNVTASNKVLMTTTNHNKTKNNVTIGLLNARISVTRRRTGVFKKRQLYSTNTIKVVATRIIQANEEICAKFVTGAQSHVSMYSDDSGSSDED